MEKCHTCGGPVKSVAVGEEMPQIMSVTLAKELYRDALEAMNNKPDTDAEKAKFIEKWQAICKRSTK